jgi:23S rRNA pseudouridine2605 synthase
VSEPAAAERLQKVLARAGLASRREIETWIEAGRVTVNGKPATLGLRVSGDDRISLDGKPVPLYRFTPRPRVLVYHKPEGEVCTRSDPQNRSTVFDNLPKMRQGRWVAVGRLDFNTSGLLILTTDGELAHRLMHPSAEIEREYAVRILGKVTEEMLTRLQQGVMLDDGEARFDTVVDAGGSGVNHWYHVTLKEGRNREVRRLWETVGAKVSRLIRVRYGNVTLARHIRPGRFDDLDDETMEALYQSVTLKLPAPEKRSSEKRQVPSGAKVARRGAPGKRPNFKNKRNPSRRGSR